MTSFSVALVHYPVLDRGGDVVTTAITNLDLHDLARSSRTYGASAVHIIHPIAAQRMLAERIKEHWVEGSGKKRIPDRADALDLLRIVPSLEDVWASLGGRDRIDVLTTAARGTDVTTFADARARIEASDRHAVIVFGTGWGLARDVIANADVRLEPIRARARSDWNHLSVRAACAIALDRLFG